MKNNLFQWLIKEDFWMLHAVTRGAYYPPVITTWKILTTGTLCSEQINVFPYPERNGFSGLPVSLRKKENVDLLSVAILQNRAHQFGKTQF